MLPAKWEQIKHINVPNNWNDITIEALVGRAFTARKFMCSNSTTEMKKKIKIEFIQTNFEINLITWTIPDKLAS